MRVPREEAMTLVPPLPARLMQVDGRRLRGSPASCLDNPARLGEVAVVEPGTLFSAGGRLGMAARWNGDSAPLWLWFEPRLDTGNPPGHDVQRLGWAAFWFDPSSRAPANEVTPIGALVADGARPRITLQFSASCPTTIGMDGIITRESRGFLQPAYLRWALGTIVEGDFRSLRRMEIAPTGWTGKHVDGEFVISPPSSRP